MTGHQYTIHLGPLTVAYAGTLCRAVEYAGLYPGARIMAQTMNPRQQ